MSDEIPTVGWFVKQLRNLGEIARNRIADAEGSLRNFGKMKAWVEAWANRLEKQDQEQAMSKEAIIIGELQQIVATQGAQLATALANQKDAADLAAETSGQATVDAFNTANPPANSSGTSTAAPAIIGTN